MAEISDDPLLAADFNIVDYFNQKYPDESCLDNIMEEIKTYDEQLKEVDLEIK
jgi:hypothetical protein